MTQNTNSGNRAYLAQMLAEKTAEWRALLLEKQALEQRLRAVHSYLTRLHDLATLEGLDVLDLPAVELALVTAPGELEPAQDILMEQLRDFIEAVLKLHPDGYYVKALAADLALAVGIDQARDDALYALMEAGAARGYWRKTSQWVFAPNRTVKRARGEAH